MSGYKSIKNAVITETVGLGEDMGGGSIIDKGRDVGGTRINGSKGGDGVLGN